MKGYRVSCDDLGWYVETNHVLSKEQIRRIADYAYKINLDRWRSMPHGSKKDHLAKLLKDLKNAKIRHKFVKEEPIWLIPGHCP